MYENIVEYDFQNNIVNNANTDFSKSKPLSEIENIIPNAGSSGSRWSYDHYIDMRLNDRHAINCIEHIKYIHIAFGNLVFN